MPTITLCMIVRNEEALLENALLSVKRFVNKIIVVDTGSTDNTKVIAKNHGAIVLDFNPTTHPQAFILDNEGTRAPGPYTGEQILADFAGARNFGWEKATTDYIMWIDADDVVRNAQQLPKLVGAMERDKVAVARLRYDYGFNEQGRPTLQQWRERIVKRGAGKWIGAIHETVDAGKLKARNYNNIVIEHRRQDKENHEIHRITTVKYRNYKILRRVLDHEGDKPTARTLFYLGNESRFFNTSEAAGYFERYLRLSFFREERALAYVYLGRIWEASHIYEQAMRCYAAATVEDPISPDGWFGMARVAYYKERWPECCQWTEEGFALGNPANGPWFNPVERQGEPHIYYNVALGKLGRTKEAATSCKNGLVVLPDNEFLAKNLKVYEAMR